MTNDDKKARFNKGADKARTFRFGAAAIRGASRPDNWKPAPKPDENTEEND